MAEKYNKGKNVPKVASKLQSEKVCKMPHFFYKNPVPAAQIEGKVQLAQIVVSQATNISLKQICAPTRSKPTVAQARQIAMYLTHVALGVSLTRTAAGFGRDRTTASHACRVVEDLRDDPHFDFQLSQLEEGLAKIAVRFLHNKNNINSNDERNSK